MLAIKKSENPTRVIANVLPCKIQHNGPVNATSRHWNPETNDMGNEKKTNEESEEKEKKKEKSTTSTSYFRGRRLCGKSVEVPRGYTGLILEKTNNTLPPPLAQCSNQEDAEMEQDETKEEIKILDQVATFDKIVVWGHEVLPEDVEDVFVRGVGEWIGFADAMHSFED